MVQRTEPGVVLYRSASIMAMGCSSTKHEFVLRIGDRDFPRHLLDRLCADSPSRIAKLVLSMRAAGFIGSLLQQLPAVTAAGQISQQHQQYQHLQEGSARAASGDSSQTVFMSDGNNYDLNADTVQAAAELPTVLAEVQELMVYHSSGHTLHDFLDLSPFTSTSYLCLVDVPVHLVHYLKTLRPRLRHISVHRCTDSPKKLFEICGGDQAFPALWTRLVVADLRWNGLRTLDDSFKLLSCLHTLDLSNNRLTDVTGLELLSSLQVLNLSYNCITHMPHLMDSTRNALRVLLLRYNRLTNIQNIEQFLVIGELDVSCNIICDFEELARLKGLRHLTKLNVFKNPFEVVHQVGRMDILRYVNPSVPCKFLLNGRALSDKEHLFLRKMRVSRMAPSSTPLTSSLVPGIPPPSVASALPSQEDSSVAGTRFEASMDSRRETQLPDTGGSEADISSSDAEGYLTNSLSARARATRNHLDKVRGRYGANWLVNMNRSEYGCSIPSPPPALLEPVNSASTSTKPSPIAQSAEGATPEAPEAETAAAAAAAGKEEVEMEEKGAKEGKETSPAPAAAEVEDGEVESMVSLSRDKSSESLLYVTAPSNFGSGSGALPSSPQSTRSEVVPQEIYPMHWEHEEEEPEEMPDLDGEGMHFVVTPLLNSGLGDQRMLVVGAKHCLLCCLNSGKVADRHELRLLTSVRREEDGQTLALAFRCADPSQRGRRFRFGNPRDCERCRAELARHLEEPEVSGGGMHCFRCRNQVDASKVARVMELDPSTGERVLVPACPHCGYRALAEDLPSEDERKGSVARSSPASSFTSSAPNTGASPETQRPTLFAGNLLSASSSTTSGSLIRVPCGWIHFDRTDFSEFDHQIKRHFALHVLTSDTEECRLHIKCHGTPYNRAEMHECVVLFTNKKFYFFRWKFHESQQVAKCLTLQDKIDLINLTSIRPGPCYQWLLLEFKNAKRSLLYPGDPTSSEHFLQQLADLLEPSVIDFSMERSQRETFCSSQLAAVVNTESGEHEPLLTTLGLSPSGLVSDEAGLWVCRCPGTKYVASSVPLTATLHKWANREVKRDWTLLVLSSGRFLTFDLEFQVGWDAPTPRFSKCWNVTDISGVKRGKDGLTLILSFFRQKGGTMTEEVPKSLSIVFEEELAMMHFFAPFQALWEHYYSIPLILK